MAWAIAASGAVFGESEWSARAVSALAATVSALVATVFGARWFGRRYGIAAGLAMAITPVFWPSGRSAEIEALNDCATMAAVLLVLELAAPAERRRPGWPAVLGGLAIAGAALAKGPAGFAAIGMAAVCGVWLGRGAGVRPAVAEHEHGSGESTATHNPARAGTLRGVLLAFAVAAAIVGVAAALIARAVHFFGLEPVTQGVSEFLWSSNERSLSGALRVLSMPFVAVASALPASFALLFPWGRDARTEAGQGFSARAVALARALGLTCISSLVLLAALGVHNPRYGLPSLSFVPVLAAYVARGWAGAFLPVRRRIAGWIFLGFRAAWPVLLLIGAAVYIGLIEPRQRATSGRGAGERLAGSLPDKAFVWADGLVEARPEVLLYAERAAAAQGKTLTFVWVPRMAERLSLPRQHDYFVLRTDRLGDEAALYGRAGFMDRLRPVASGSVYKYSFTVYQMVRPGASGELKR
jgi:hypothetical protein